GVQMRPTCLFRHKNWGALSAAILATLTSFSHSRVGALQRKELNDRPGKPQAAQTTNRHPRWWFRRVYAAIHLEKLLAREGGFEICLVSRDDFFLFTPMLHEIAASDL